MDRLDDTAGHTGTRHHPAVAVERRGTAHGRVGIQLATTRTVDDAAALPGDVTDRSTGSSAIGDLGHEGEEEQQRDADQHHGDEHRVPVFAVGFDLSERQQRVHVVPTQLSTSYRHG